MGRSNEQFIDQRAREENGVQARHDYLRNSTYEQVENEAARIAESVEDGYADPIEVAAWMRRVKAMADLVLKSIDEEVTSAAHSFSKGEKRDEFGYIIEAVEAGVKYDYTTCEDSAWERMDAEAKGLKSRMNERQKWLKLLPGPMADPETGEIVKPPVRTSKTTLKFTPNK